MKTRKRILAVLLLVLVTALTLEAALWLRAIGSTWLQESYPFVGVAADDTPAYWRQRYQEMRGRRSGYLRFYDENREVIREIDYSTFEGRVGSNLPEVTASPQIAGRGSPWERFDNPVFIDESTRGRSAGRHERHWAEELLASFNAVQTRGYRLTEALHWTFEAGRFYCRSMAEGDPVVVLGADGLGPNTSPFGRMRVVYERGDEQGKELGVERQHLLLDLDNPALVDIRTTHVGRNSPNRVVIERRPLHEVDSLAGLEGTLFGLVEMDSERLLIDEQGRILARGSRSGVACEGEVYSDSFGRSAGMSPWHWQRRRKPVPLDWVRAKVLTIPQPVDPLGVRMRLHVFHAGRPVTVVETHLEPVTAWERFLAGIALLPEFARPLPLCVASMAAAPPDTWEECNAWWLLTPSLAGGKRAGLLALIVLVSALAAWIAWRWGRARCATAGQARFWAVAVFLTGPMGLLWMRVVLPRVRVEKVGGSRRAVDLDASPSTDEPWPAPVSTGIEVIGV